MEVENNTTPSQVLEISQDVQNINEQKQKIYENDRKRLERAEYYLKKYVHENANPSPVFVLGIFILVLVILWVLYLMFIKPNASGIWYDDENNMWEINHCYFRGLTVRLNGENVKCQISDNLFKCGSLLGIWNYSDIIVFINGGSLTRVK